MPLTVEELVEQERRSLQREATALPPLPVLTGGDNEGVDPRIQTGLTPADDLSFRDKALKGAWDLFKHTGIPQVAGLTVEGIERTDTAFRASVLTAVGKIPLESYPQYWKDAWDGKVKISGKEFLRLAVGADTMQMLDRVGVPLWMKQVSNPDPWLAGQTPETLPVVSVGSVAGLLSEMFVSPLAIASFAPVNAFKATKVGRAVKTVFGPAERAISYPLRKTLNLTLNNPRLPGSQFIQQLRDPVGAMSRTPLARKIVTEMTEADAEMQRDAVKWLQEGVLGDIAKKYEKVIKPRSSADALAGKILFEVEDIAMAPVGSPLRNFIEEVRERVIKPNWDELSQMGYHNPMNLTGKSSRVPTEEWTRDRLLGAFNPALTHRHNVTRALGEKKIRQRGKIHLNFRNKTKDGSLPEYFEGVTDENWSAWHALSEWLVQARKKAVFERRHRTTKTVKRVRKLGPAGRSTAPNQMALFDLPKTVTEEITIHPWSNTGFLAKYAPRGGWKEGGKRIPGNNPNLQGLDISEFHYLMWKVNDFTGNARGRHMILEGLVGEKFWAGVEAAIESKARKGRIRSYFYNKTRKLVNPAVGYDFPAFMAPQRMSHMFISNVMTATLGGNLSTALKQTSQLINIGAVKGIPALWRGMYRQVDMWSEEGKMLRTLRKEAGLGNTLKKIVYDFEWQGTLGSTFNKIMFAPFNAMENFARGTSANIAVVDFLEKRGIGSYDDLMRAIQRGGTLPASMGEMKAGSAAARPLFWDQLMREMRAQSNDTNLLYGLAGRSSLMSSPIARTATALQSYSWKEAEFIARTFQRDGSSVLRLLAMHGWAIGFFDRIAGINAENWLGWGFLPPNTLGRGPQVQFMQNFIGYLMAAGSNNDAAAEQHVNALQGNLREVFRMIGNPDVPGEIPAIVNGLAMAGMLPVPMVAIARSAKTANEFFTMEREYSQGAQYRPITKSEALRSAFFTSHEEHAMQQLRQMNAQAVRIVRQEIDKRTDKALKALQKTDGDAVSEAFDELASVIQVGFGTSIPRALFFRDQDSDSFYPPPSMIIPQLMRKVRMRTIARPVYEMVYEDNFATDLYWAKYIQQSLGMLQSGFIRPLQERQQGAR